MLGKLAFKEAKRSLSSYGVFFFSLTLAIAIFYAFSSVYPQMLVLLDEAVVEKNLASLSVLESAMKIAGFFVALMFIFLVGYASTFFFKGKKRRIALFLMLGMERKEVAGIQILQSLLVSVLSFVSGIAVGIGLSQLLALLTSFTFAGDASLYRFYFGTEGFLATLVFFLALFVLVSLFTLFSIGRTPLTELSQSPKKGEDKGVCSYKKTIILFLAIAIALYVVGCALMVIGFMETCFCVFIIGSISGFLFFYSFSSLLNNKVKRSKGYYKGLNPFVYKEFFSRLHSASLTLAFIGLTIILTFVLMGLGFGIQFGYKGEDNWSGFSYIGLYMGGSFLLTSLAILGLRQVSATTESKDCYLFLAKLGASRSEITGAALRESALYYLAPLLFAFVPSLCASIGASLEGQKYMGADLSGGIFLALGIILAVYLLYYFFIALKVRKIVNARKER
jgi:hypothetical protein